jgi:translocation and assembly module TamB
MAIVRRTLRFTTKLVAGVVVVAVLLLVGVYGALRGGLLTSRLDRLVTALAQKEGVFFVRAEGIEGAVPDEVRARKVEVGDRDGVWLVVEDAVATWHPFDLFHLFDPVKWRIAIDDIRARKVTWTRLPNDEDEEDEQPFRWDRFVRIVVGHIVVDDFVLTGDLLGGATARVRAEGSGILGEWEHGFVKLDIEHVDGVEGTAKIDLRTHGSPLHLEGSIHAEEGPGGALAGLARLDDAGAVTLDVRASGPMRDWRGEADIVAENIGKLSAAVRLAFTAEGPFEATGSFDPVPAQREKWLVGPGAPMSVYAKGAWAPDVALDLERVVLGADGRQLTAAGHLDLETFDFTVGGNLAHEREGEVVVTTLIDVFGARIEGGGRLGDGGRLHATLDLSQPAVGDIHGRELRATFAATDPKGEDAAPDFELVASAAGLKLGDVTLPLFGDAAKLSGKGKIDLEAGALTTPSALLEGADITVKGPVAFSDEWQSLKASLAADASSLESLARVFETTVRGRASATAEIEAGEEWDRLSVKVDASASGVSIGEPGWDALVGESVALRIDAQGAPGGPARGSATLKTVGIDATAKGEVGADGEGLVVDASATLDNLARLAEPTHAAIAGRLQAKAVARGRLDSFDVEGSVRGDRVSWEGVRFDKLVADVDAKGLPETWAGRIRSAGSYGSVNASLDAGVAMPSRERLVVKDLVLRGPRTEGHAASLDIDLARGVATGDVRLVSADLAAWRPMTGQAIGGSVQLDAKLAAGSAGGASSPGGAGRAGWQAVSGTMKVARGQLPLDGGELSVEALDVAASGLEVGRAPRGSARVTATRLRYDDRTLVEATLTAAGDGRQWDLAAKFDLRDQQQWKLDAAGTLVPATPHVLTLARAGGELGGTAVALAGPATFTFDPYAGASAPWSAGPLVVRVGSGGELRGRAASANGRTSIEAEAVAMPLEVASLFAPELDLEGTADGRVKLEGASLASLAGDLSLRGRNVSSRGLEEQGTVSPVDVHVDARMTAGRVKGTAELQGLTQTRFALSVDAPLDAAAGNAPFTAGLVWKGDVAEIATLFPLSDDAIGGTIDADLKMTGTLASPRVTGRASVAGGKWDHAISGLVLRDIAAEMVGSGTSLEIRSLTATDGEAGRFSGAGRLRFGELPAFDLEVDVEAKDAMLARLDILTARADASLELRASRTADDNADVHGSISGKVVVNDGRIAIPERFVSDVPEIEVVEVGAEVAAAIETVHVAKTLLDLEIGIVADNRIFVSGRGLESEWASDLHVRGNTHDPRLEGKITSVRGQLSLLGRRFDVDSATLLFNGEQGNVPYLTMTARAEANDVTAIAVVTGLATRPAIELRSEPALPRDEVLSRVLFGQSAANLTPMQSIQLARGVAELTGSPLGGGGGFMTGIGQTLGFDRLDIESAGSEGDAALTASKYITDNVYLRVQGGLTPESSKLSLEWRVLKNVTIDSDVSQDAQGEVGVTWKWDY